MPAVADVFEVSINLETLALYSSRSKITRNQRAFEFQYKYNIPEGTTVSHFNATLEIFFAKYKFIFTISIMSYVLFSITFC